MSIQSLFDEGVKLFHQKEYKQAIAKLQEALKSIADKNTKIQQQINIQHWLGRCYLEHAIKSKLADAKSLFEQAIKHYTKQLKLAKTLTGENAIQQQNNAQGWLGWCYLEYAIKSNLTDAKPLFEKAIEHHKQQLALAEQLEDKSEQNNAQGWLGRCYLEHAIKSNLTDAKPLFEKAIEHYTKRLELAEQLEDKSKQINAQHWLGRCYLEHAIKSNLADAKPLFEKAIEHYKQELALTEQLEDKSEQNNAQGWLGRCYLEHAIKSNLTDAKPLFDKAIEHYTTRLKLAKQLEDKSQQIYAQNGLGRCYLEHAIKSNLTDAHPLFKKAIEHYEQELALAEQLEDKSEQNNAQGWLGQCYLEYAIKSNLTDAKPLFEEAIEHHKQQLALAEKLKDENAIQQQIYAHSSLGRCYLELKKAIKNKNDKKLLNKAIKNKNDKKLLDTAIAQYKKALKKSENQIDNTQIHYKLSECYFRKKDINKAFEQKNKYIALQLSDYLKSDFKYEIVTILAVLNIQPVELEKIPLAHYTSPYVANLLLGLNDEYSPMRMNSATYMNDPTEGKSLLEFLGQPDYSLENMAKSPAQTAFFSCFSSRVNDLNQFRLYGKEKEVNASACCLVFNKKRNWLKQADITQSFRQTEGNKDEILSTDTNDNKGLPLYQVAYLAYLDQYINPQKCKKFNDKNDKQEEKFAFCLHQVGKNKKWHQKREEELKKALNSLRKKLSKKTTLSQQEKDDLQYIRYLFKDFAFRDEEEFRLLQIAKIGGSDIQYCETTKAIYIEYGDIRDNVDEVILGTNYEKTGEENKVEVFRYKIKKRSLDIEVSQSSLPINPK